jgi:Zn-finger protein
MNSKDPWRVFTLGASVTEWKLFFFSLLSVSSDDNKYYPARLEAYCNFCFASVFNSEEWRVGNWMGVGG